MCRAIQSAGLMSDDLPTDFWQPGQRAWPAHTQNASTSTLAWELGRKEQQIVIVHCSIGRNERQEK